MTIPRNRLSSGTQRIYAKRSVLCNFVCAQRAGGVRYFDAGGERSASRYAIVAALPG